MAARLRDDPIDSLPGEVANRLRHLESRARRRPHPPRPLARRAAMRRGPSASWDGPASPPERQRPA